MGVYQIGDAVTLQASFESLAGVLTDPTAVTLSVIDPAGVTTTYTLVSGVTKVADGVFQCVVTPALVGRWVYKWAGTGAVQAASPDTYFVVQPTQFQ
jgi:hypothetical protein